VVTAGCGIDDEGFAEGYAGTHKKSLAENLVEERKEMVRRYKALGVSTDIIVQATGLTKDEAEGL